MNLRCLVWMVPLVVLVGLPTVHADRLWLDSYATDGGDRYWFSFQGYAGENPTLRLRSGDQVQVAITNAGNQPHNIHFGSPIARGSQYLMPGVSQNFTFTVPGGTEPQTIEYWCDPHRQLGMVGTILLAGANGTTQSGAETPRTIGAVDAWAPVGAVVAVALAVAMGRRTR